MWMKWVTVSPSPDSHVLQRVAIPHPTFEVLTSFPVSIGTQVSPLVLGTVSKVSPVSSSPVPRNRRRRAAKIITWIRFKQINYNARRNASTTHKPWHMNQCNAYIPKVLEACAARAKVPRAHHEVHTNFGRWSKTKISNRTFKLVLVLW